ncbi:MAG TPA: bifunctional DNA-formamidopyrimidine glycosylase/DNA-(apurinic or apyrimidinic site) lyase [Candidatus Glassbacteria bacterium]|nr:bifunctional DNA-formamidopyrimidine glycosylase/DNA-(apurinic or apyrimidinic site) lyase [Candidatus Glassbacteria bacterium]
MPELPEVETTLRGIYPHLIGRRIHALVVRNADLRWPLPAGLGSRLQGQVINGITRRAKYLLFALDRGWLILHLGMSGSLRIVLNAEPPEKHDHVDIVFSPDRLLRFHDPRRFGALLYTKQPPGRHKLLRDLGPEPLGDQCTGEYLYQQSRGRKQAIKGFIMDSRVVVGVGNIYASESLYRSGIHPLRAAGRIALPRYVRLMDAIRQVLRASIAAGGTTLRDFVGESGQTGYFIRKLQVYGREGAACLKCGGAIRQLRIGQRASFYCPNCQR